MRALNDWIDFMEGEGTSKQIERMGLLLKHSIPDQLILDNLRRLRRAVKKSGLAQKPLAQMDQSEFLTNFHARVMKEVSEHHSKRARQTGRTLFRRVGQGLSLNSYKS